MKRCFGYIRVSTVRQGDGASLEAQKDAILAFADRNKIEIVRWLEEKETAAKRGRPIFNRMIADLKKRKADGVVVHKIDRFTRNLIDYGKISELIDMGVDVFTAIEPLDFQTRGGRLAADVQAVVAADQVRNLREECIKGLYGRLKQGLYPFKAPIGYLNNGGGKLKTPDPERVHHIRDAFELYGSGQYSQRSLLVELNRRGFRSRLGRPVSLTSLEAILANSFYCGIIRIKVNGQTFHGRHEPIIPASLFERVQDLKAGKAVKKVTKHNHTYRRLFRCGLCGTAMIPERQKGHVYYRCQNKPCPTKTVREELLEDTVQRCLEGVRLSDHQIDVLVARLTQWTSDRNDLEARRQLPLQFAAIAAKRERLTDALIDRLIEKQIFEERNAKLHLEEAKLREYRLDLEKRSFDSEQTRNFLELVKTLAHTYACAAPAQKQQIAKLATSNRTIVRRRVYVEPANWLQDVGTAVAALNGPPSRGADRTFLDRLARLTKDETTLNLINLSAQGLDLTELSHFRGTISKHTVVKTRKMIKYRELDT